MSAMAVITAGALYAKFVRDNRGHLIHLSECLEGTGDAKQRKARQRGGLGLQDFPSEEDR